MRSHVGIGDRISISEGPLPHSASQDSVFADCPQSAKSLHPLLRTADWTADIAVEIQDYVIFTAEIEKPLIPLVTHHLCFFSEGVAQHKLRSAILGP